MKNINNGSNFETKYINNQWKIIRTYICIYLLQKKFEAIFTALYVIPSALRDTKWIKHRFMTPMLEKRPVIKMIYKQSLLSLILYLMLTPTRYDWKNLCIKLITVIFMLDLSGPKSCPYTWCLYRIFNDKTKTMLNWYHVYKIFI